MEFAIGIFVHLLKSDSFVDIQFDDFVISMYGSLHHKMSVYLPFLKVLIKQDNVWISEKLVKNLYSFLRKLSTL